MEDETANWQLGNRNWIGSNYQFRDNAAKSLDNINQQIATLEGQELQTLEQQNQLAHLKKKQFDYNELIKLHNKEIGQPVGDFKTFMRTSVKTKKQKMIWLDQEMRQATARNDKAKLQELQQEKQQLAETLNDYRTWAGQPQQ
jgi:hypothetical protein